MSTHISIIAKDLFKKISGNAFCTGTGIWLDGATKPWHPVISNYLWCTEKEKEYANSRLFLLDLIFSLESSFSNHWCDERIWRSWVKSSLLKYSYQTIFTLPARGKWAVNLATFEAMFCCLTSRSDELLWQVKVLHIDNEEDWSESDVLIMGTDGLWDVTSNDKVAEIVTKSFRQFPPDENRIRYRYVGKYTELFWNNS